MFKKLLLLITRFYVFNFVKITAFVPVTNSGALSLDDFSQSFGRGHYAGFKTNTQKATSKGLSIRISKNRQRHISFNLNSFW